MKGVYSSPDSLLYRASQQRALSRTTSMVVDSGGDPRVIPQLTYAQFKHFTRAITTPPTRMIFFYGDDDPARTAAHCWTVCCATSSRAEVDSRWPCTRPSPRRAR
jgi:Zn-dependent M16 (insulinase) family peptidase